MIEVILWDVDGTLLDFKAAEKAAIQRLFKEFSLGECTDTMIKNYSAINQECWNMLEKGEIEKQRMLQYRFELFFKSEGIDTSYAEKFNKKYQHYLGDTIVYKDNSLEIVKSLKGKIPQYMVSNGTRVAQIKKLHLSGLDKLADGIFLSEDVGAEKPNTAFFDKVFATIGEDKREKSIIIGDSIGSDILGGKNAGIKTCWYNPEKKKNTTPHTPDYEIENLNKIYRILENN